MIRMPRGTNGWTAALAALLAAALVTVRSVVAESPAGKEIAEVIIQGNRKRTTEEILAKLETRPGQRYSEITAQADAGRLVKEGWFLPNGVSIRHKDDRVDGKITVIIEVAELPSVVKAIIYNGANHIDADDLEKLTGLRTGMPMSPAVNMAARQAILRKYQEKGRIWAGVYLTEGGKLDDTRVVFDIAEGPNAKISSIDVEYFGPTTSDISSARLKTQLTSGRSYLNNLIGGEYNPTQIDQDLQKLADYYHGMGFLHAKVSRELIWSDDHHTVKVIFHVEEGKRCKVAKVQIDGSRSFKEERLLAFTDLREGDYYEKFVVQGDVQRIKNYYGYGGRPVVVRETVHEAGDGIVNVHYQIEEKEPVRVGEVKIIVDGSRVTKDNVIRRQVPIYPGQILSYPDMLDAERALSRTGLFEDDQMNGIKPTVEVENPEVDEPYKNILVRVKDKPTGSFMVGAGVTSDAGLTGNVVINERNFDILHWPTSWDDIFEGRAWRGAGQEFRIEAVPGTTMQRYTVSFREPYLFDSRYSGGISGYYFTRTYNEYTEDRIGGRLTFGRRLTNLWTVSLTERVEDVDVVNVQAYEPTQITKYEGHSTVLGTRLDFTRDERDSVLRPTAGSMLTFGGEFVTGTYTFPLATMEASKYWTTWQRKDGSGRQVLAFRTQMSYAGDNTPVFERFYAGGFRSMRGFTFRGVGPIIDGYNIGGDFAYLNSLEYQIPVMANDNLYVVGFIDSGTVEQSVEIKDYRVTAGMGLRIAIPQLLGPVPLALDFALPINQAPGDHKQLFSFWMGFFN